MTAINSKIGQRRNRKLLPELGTLTLAASQTFYPGGLVAHAPGSNLAVAINPAAPNADLIIVGCATHYQASTSSVDGNGNALDADGANVLTIEYECGLLGAFDTGSGANQITDANRGLPCFAYDNNTLYATSLNGTLPYAGIVHDVASEDGLRVIFLPESGGLGAIFAAGESGLQPLLTQETTCRGVITSLAAYTGAGTGTLTVTATGALGAQDGLTPAAGQIFHLPVYTGTANASVAVAPADSGPYEVVNPGGTGISPVLTRPATWKHGATINQETLVKVGGEGTLFANSKWYSGVAPGKVVGTDDPVLYPDKVVQTTSLAASTVAITNVPIRSATKTNISAELAAAGGTTTNTVKYGPIVAPTPGPLGTASATVDAIASGGGKNGTIDTSSLIITITQ